MEPGHYGSWRACMYGKKSKLRFMSGQFVVRVGIFKRLQHKIFKEKESRAFVQRNSSADLSGKNTEGPSRETVDFAPDRRTCRRPFSSSGPEMDGARIGDNGKGSVDRNPRSRRKKNYMHRAINPRYKNLDLLRDDYKKKRESIRRRLNEFRAIARDDYFYELVYCLMTPQSSAVNSAKAQSMLSAHNFRNAEIDPEPLLHQKEYYIRFHKTKAKLLVAMKSQYNDILEKISNGEPIFEKRKWLAENVKGMGYKEATHFLRNVGLNEGLAILDRHILKNLKKHGAIRSLPKTLTKKKYLAYERRFQKFAENIGIPIDELDLLFWSNETGEILK